MPTAPKINTTTPQFVKLFQRNLGKVKYPSLDVATIKPTKKGLEVVGTLMVLDANENDVGDTSFSAEIPKHPKNHLDIDVDVENQTDLSAKEFKKLDIPPQVEDSISDALRSTMKGEKVK
jgi:hypothetical protein